MEWSKGLATCHYGWWIEAVEENGRKFWSTIDPTPIGMVIRQEFCSLDDAMKAIEEREVEKTLWRIKYGK